MTTETRSALRPKAMSFDCIPRRVTLAGSTGFTAFAMAAMSVSTPSGISRKRTATWPMVLLGPGEAALRALVQHRLVPAPRIAAEDRIAAVGAGELGRAAARQGHAAAGAPSFRGRHGSYGRAHFFFGPRRGAPTRRVYIRMTATKTRIPSR